MKRPNIKLIKQRFGKDPMLFEINPPPIDEKDDQLEKHNEYLEQLLNEVDVSAINLPEIQDEEQKGEKGERKSSHRDRVPPREYARDLSREELQFVVNRVIVQASWVDQEKWLIDTHNNYELKTVVLVGGESSDVNYPGPSVTEGNQLIKDNLNQGKSESVSTLEKSLNYLVGNICISTRRREDFDEPERMARKIETGADFFTSQILAEPESGVELLEDLARHLVDNDIPAPYIFWSFTPIGSQKDINFLRWLGVKIPSSLEDRILSSNNPHEYSLNWIEDIWNQLNETRESLDLNIPLGLNICPVAMRNYEKSIELARRLQND